MKDTLLKASYTVDWPWDKGAVPPLLPQELVQPTMIELIHMKDSAHKLHTAIKE